MVETHQEVDRICHDGQRTSLLIEVCRIETFRWAPPLVPFSFLKSFNNRATPQFHKDDYGWQ
jgi:hypothetical protein